MINITYSAEIVPETEQIIEVYESSGINRPTKDKERISEMYRHSNLVVSAWDNDILVGIARSLTDFCYCCYLSDLAVREAYKNKGIGKELIEQTKQIIGDKTTLILLSAPAAMGYYPKLGFEKTGNGFIIKRTR